MIRAARAGDEDVILSLLHELAEYEKLLDVFKITHEVIARDYLGAQPLIECVLAFEDGEPAGIAAWCWIYASFAARRDLYLEDLYVRPAFRGRGLGKAFIAHLAKQAAEAGAARLEWVVLDWNAPAIEFYERLGAHPVKGWHRYRLEGDALAALSRS